MKKTALLNYKGLFGDQEAPFQYLPVHYEPLQTRSEIYDYEIIEHLHTNLVQVFIISSGGGLLLSAGRRIKIEAPCVLVIPSNTMHGFAFQSEVRGGVFTLSDDWFEDCLQQSPPVFQHLDQLQYLAFEHAKATFETIIEWQDKITTALAQRDETTRRRISLLFQLLLLNLRSSETVYTSFPTAEYSRALQHYRAFKTLLKQFAYEEKTARFYAQELALTTVHLNRICKTITGQTTREIIHSYLVAEACKYLQGTSYSIAEIAYFLGFKDPAHFSKLFKKVKGETPRQFRNQQ